MGLIQLLDTGYIFVSHSRAQGRPTVPNDLMMMSTHIYDSGQPYFLLCSRRIGLNIGSWHSHLGKADMWEEDLCKNCVAEFRRRREKVWKEREGDGSTKTTGV